MAAMQWADACALILPCGRSAHLEAGWFAGSGRPVFITLMDVKVEPELMYLMASAVCLDIPELLDVIADPRRHHPITGPRADIMS
jgi:hypothetical protein